jgi:hypothetical protein
MKPNRVKLVISLALFAVMLAACGKSPAGTAAAIISGSTAAPTINNVASGACTNAYYPNAVGDNWTFSSTGSGIGSYTYTEAVTKSGDAGFTTSYQFSTGVNSTIDWNCKDGNLSALDAGAASFSMSTSKVQMTSNSATADGYNIPATFAPGETWSEDVTVDGTVTENGTTKSIDSQITNNLSCTGDDSESVTVPAGTFTTAKATCTKKVVISYTVSGKTQQVGSNQETIDYWYAKGVGFVKSVASGGSDNETIVLTQYKTN